MKVLRKLYIIIFIAICFSLFVLMPFSHSDMDVEKRDAAAFPEVHTEDGKLNMKYFDELTDYVSDNFAFRQELATVDAVWKSKLFGYSNQEKVVVGKNEWLYFNGSLDDYFGRDVLNDRETYAAAKTISLMQEYSESKNCKFAFAIAPNKNTLYPENMPDNYIATDKPSNIEKLRDVLNSQKTATGEAINYVDLQDTFLSQDKVMYHKWDSHWNNEGATLACDRILSSLDKEHYDYSNEPSRVLANHSGDVWQLIYPSWEKKDENVIYDKEHTYEYMNPVESVEDMLIVTSSPDKEGSVVMFRDSFGNALLPYVADEYSQGMFVKGMPLNVKMIDQGTDTLIYELVERNIPNIIAYLPVMDAPVRELGDMDIEAVQDSKATADYEDKSDKYVIFGKLDPEYVKTDTDIYIRVTKADGSSICFEATPGSYNDSDRTKDMSYNYGAYISKDYLGEGDSIDVICFTDDNYYNVLSMEM